MALLVTYDLTRGSREDYSRLFDELKSPPTNGWWHHLESTWILSTEETPDQLYRRIEPHIHDDDNILIVRIDGQPRQGWLKEKAWTWLRKHVPRR